MAARQTSTSTQAPKAPTHLPLPESMPSAHKAQLALHHAAINALHARYEELRKQSPVLAKQDAGKVKEIIRLWDERKLDQLPVMFTRLSDEFKSVKDKLTAEIADLKRQQKATQSQVDSVRSTVHDLGKRVAEDHDSVVDLKLRVKKLEELGIDPKTLRGALEAGSANGRHAFVRYALSHGVSQDQLKAFFGTVELPDQTVDLSNMTDEEFFHELLTTVMKDRSETDRRLNTLDTRVDGHEQRLNEHDGKFGEFNELSTRVETIETTVKSFGDRAKDSFPFLFGGAVAAIVGLFIWLPDRMPGTPWYNELGLAAFIGAIAGIIASFIVSDNNQVEKVKHIREERKTRKAKSKSTEPKVNATEGSDNPKGSKPEGAPESSDASKTPEPANASS